MFVRGKAEFWPFLNSYVYPNRFYISGNCKKRLSNDLVKLVLSLCFFLFLFFWLKPGFYIYLFFLKFKFIKIKKNLLV